MQTNHLATITGSKIVSSDLPTISFRSMTQDDVDAVLAIEQKAYDFPWAKSIFMNAVDSTKYCAVIQTQNDIIGYGIISFVVGEVELLNLCIHPDQQGNGYAQKLLEHLISVAKEKDNHEMYLEVRVSNMDAIHVYEKFGFNEIGRRKNYYPGKGGREDAILMALPLIK